MEFKISDALTALAVLVSTLTFILANSRARKLQQEQRRRELVTSQLAECYGKIESACNRPRDSEYLAGLEDALANIQLLGSEKQIQLAHQFMNAYGGSGDVGNILTQLRDELRSEIGLAPVKSKVLFFRMEKKRSSTSA